MSEAAKSSWQDPVKRENRIASRKRCMRKYRGVRDPDDDRPTKQIGFSVDADTWQEILDEAEVRSMTVPELLRLFVRKGLG